ncbi:alpha/beta hydrolase [Novosphingobium sp.]|uniref:alpha/beta fold hydrolase n=1 Tax=Novosphingobium sp. TaxID=1874826 RepID=UPI001EC7DCE3|nr:alpha/beta hydrolase [Novosphingobium sp.]MBK9009813.1 alpha/beta hydrolase [Novosphingobium sp.]
MLGLPVVYLHGMPGGPGEWNLLAPHSLKESAFAPDRNGPEASPEAIAARLAERNHDGMVLIGFSLGAPVALHLAHQLGDRVRALHLVSPAAPLQLGSFLPQMAGGPLFALAARRPRLFRLVAAAQRLMARHAPGLLFTRLFASAQGADAALAATPAFKEAMAGVLREGLGCDPQGFAREVAAYVRDWRGELAAPLTMPVTIWQGSADNWTPPAMAEALHASLSGSRLVMLEGCSHYTALREALARLA